MSTEQQQHDILVPDQHIPRNPYAVLGLEPLMAEDVREKADNIAKDIKGDVVPSAVPMSAPAHPRALELWEAYRKITATWQQLDAVIKKCDELESKLDDEHTKRRKGSGDRIQKLREHLDSARHEEEGIRRQLRSRRILERQLRHYEAAGHLEAKVAEIEREQRELVAACLARREELPAAVAAAADPVPTETSEEFLTRIEQPDEGAAPKTLGTVTVTHLTSLWEGYASIDRLTEALRETVAKARKSKNKTIMERHLAELGEAVEQLVKLAKKKTEAERDARRIQRTIALTDTLLQEDDVIRKRHRDLSKQLHTDRNPGDKLAEKQFKEVEEAYDALTNADPDARRALARNLVFGQRTELWADQQRSSADAITKLFAGVCILERPLPVVDTVTCDGCRGSGHKVVSKPNSFFPPLEVCDGCRGEGVLVAEIEHLRKTLQQVVKPEEPKAKKRKKS